MEKLVLLCEDSFDGIMSAVYKGWELKKNKEVVIKAGELEQVELFAEYITLETDFELSKKVIRTLGREFPSDIYVSVFRASMSNQPDKAGCRHQRVRYQPALHPGG